MDFVVEAQDQTTVRGRLKNSSRRPDERKQDESRQSDALGLITCRFRENPYGGRKLRDHRRHDYPPGSHGVRLLVSNPSRLADLRHERVVNDLNEDDQARHEDGGNEVDVECGHPYLATTTMVDMASMRRAGTDLRIGSRTFT